MSVAYCHDVKLGHLAFWLFRNSGKSDFMSNIRNISNSFLELKDRYLIDNKNVNISTEIQMFSFHWMMKNSSFNVFERAFGVHKHQNSLNFNHFIFIINTLFIDLAVSKNRLA